jgi:plasmid stabilization system protein ParE
MKINYSLESIRDLIRLREFIEVKNPDAAERIASELLAGIDNLKVFPRMGIPVTHAPDSDVIRDLFVGKYTVRYLLGSQDIFILRVWHEKEIGKDI